MKIAVIRKAIHAKQGDLIIITDPNGEQHIRQVCWSNGAYYGYDLRSGELLISARSIEGLISAYNKTANKVEVYPIESVTLNIEI